MKEVPLDKKDVIKNFGNFTRPSEVDVFRGLHGLQRFRPSEIQIFNKKYLLLDCVVYRLTTVFLIQAMN